MKSLACEDTKGIDDPPKGIDDPTTYSQAPDVIYFLIFLMGHQTPPNSLVLWCKFQKNQSGTPPPDATYLVFTILTDLKLIYSFNQTEE